MNRMIGFDRKIQLDWLDATVGLCQQRLDPDAFAKRLKQKLESEIAGPEARRKTATVLLRIWVNVPEESKSLRDEGLGLAEQVQPDERLWLHWGMSLLAYPFFRDVAATAGQLGRLQDSFSQTQIYRRMIERWGQRTTLQRAAQRLVRTFAEWGVLAEAKARGSYTAAPVLQTTHQELALWLLDCALRAHRSKFVPLCELGHLPYTFPFDLLPFANHVRWSARFAVDHQGLDLEMVTFGQPDRN